MRKIVGIIVAALLFAAWCAGVRIAFEATVRGAPPQAPPIASPLQQAPAVEETAPPVQSLIPLGAEKYEPTKWTQAIYVLSGYGDRIDQVPIRGTRRKWHQSGGMEGIAGVTSEKYRLVPSKPKEWVGTVQVWNGNNYQPNRGMMREYPSGTRFDDVLSYGGKVFEHRVREKNDGGWTSDVIYSDNDARPPGYTGLKVTCASCHSMAGKGKPEADGRSTYATGLPPGSDTVLSDPLPWHLTNRRR